MGDIKKHNKTAEACYFTNTKSRMGVTKKAPESLDQNETASEVIKAISGLLVQEHCYTTSQIKAAFICSSLHVAIILSSRLLF